MNRAIQFLALVSLIIGSLIVSEPRAQQISGGGGACSVGQLIRSSNSETGVGAVTSTVTVTIASPAVLTWGATTPFTGVAVVNFTTTGALPTGLTVGTNYYLFNISGNTANIATSVDNAIAGTAINTSGSQSGTHTGQAFAIMATGTPLNLAGVSLPSGEWDVTNDIGFLAASTTSVSAWFSGNNSVSATLSRNPGQLSEIAIAATVPSVTNTIIHAGPMRYSLGGTTTIYAVMQATFTISTLSAWGGMAARRATC